MDEPFSTQSTESDEYVAPYGEVIGDVQSLTAGSSGPSSDGVGGFFGVGS